MSSNPSTEKVENKLQREWSWKDLYCWLFRDSYKSDVICFIALMLTLLPPKEHIAAGLRQTLKTSMTNVWILISLVLLYLLRCFFFYEINLKIAKKKNFFKKCQILTKLQSFKILSFSQNYFYISFRNWHTLGSR